MRCHFCGRIAVNMCWERTMRRIQSVEWMQKKKVAKSEYPPLASNKLNYLPDPMMELVWCDSSASSMSSIS